MKPHQSILLFITSLIIHALLFVTLGWSTELHPTKNDNSGDQPLSLLVQKFLKSDSNSEEIIKGQILSHPDAKLETVISIIKDGTEFNIQQVGIQKNQEIRVRGRTYQYGLYVPPSYNPGSAYSLIICLHGAGFTGDSYLNRWVSRLNDQYILACPTISMGAWWSRSAEELVLATIKRIRARYHIDPDRIFLTGMSNGGIGAWIIGMHQSPLFAGVSPMASGIDKVLYPFLENLRQTSVYVIHGLHDQVMPVWLSQDLVSQMKNRGIKYVYREHKLSHPHAGGHFFPREELPALVGWFDRQRRDPLPRQITVVRDATHLQRYDWVRIDVTNRIAAFSEDLIDSRDEYIDGQVYAKLYVKIVNPNHIIVTTHLVKRYTLFLNEDLVDFSEPITIETNGQESYHGTIEPCLDTLLHEARVRQDHRQLFPAQVSINIPN